MALALRVTSVPRCAIAHTVPRSRRPQVVRAGLWNAGATRVFAPSPFGNKEWAGSDSGFAGKISRHSRLGKPCQAVNDGASAKEAMREASFNVEEGAIKTGMTIFDKTKEAVARISSGLYVVTAAADKSTRSAMVASWVAQASFEPLGLSIAVAKNRAIESFMQDGDYFVLNCLGEEDSSGSMRHFLQNFPDGADRFEGVSTFSEPHSASLPVLSAAIAYMRCKVVSRLETPDHWLLYCEVEDGEVLRPEEHTAVRHRKSGTDY